LDQQTFYIIVAIAAVVITLSFIIQMAMFIGIFLAVKKLNRVAADLQAKANPVIEKVGPLVEQVRGTVTKVSGSVEKISAQALETFEKVTVESRAIAAAVSVTSQDLTQLARQQAGQISQTIERTTSTLQRQVADLDGLLTRTQGRIEDTSIEVQSTVIQPMREMSALLAGLKRTIDALFRRERKQIDQAYQDEEMFI
jgi:hypothetical protein